MFISENKSYFGRIASASGRDSFFFHFVHPQRPDVDPFYFSRPIPPDAFVSIPTALLARHRHIASQDYLLPPLAFSFPPASPPRSDIRSSKSQRSLSIPCVRCGPIPSGEDS